MLRVNILKCKAFVSPEICTVEHDGKQLQGRNWCLSSHVSSALVVKAVRVIVHSRLAKGFASLVAIFMKFFKSIL